MPYLTKYHLREQQADTLLGPVCATLRELERRAGHYVARLELEPGEVARVRAAQQALAIARAEVERLQQGVSK